MNNHLENVLRIKYENLGYCVSVCNDGWYWLIDQTLETLQFYIKNNPHLKLSITIQDIKEKFSGLRLYIDCTDPFINGVIHLAESLSYNVCEYCGTLKKVSRRKNESGWLKTLCNSCADKLNFKHELKR